MNNDGDYIQKLLIVSDSHMNTENILQAIKHEKPDMLIHLGDIEDDPDDIQDFLNKVVNEAKGRPADEYVRSVYIKGNCDRLFKDKMIGALLFDINDLKVLATHGHGFYIDAGVDDLLAVAKEKSCDIVMYGHTHAYHDEVIDGVRFLNPGSIAFPRKGELPSYMVITFDDSGNYEVQKRIFGKDNR